jgi:hypothetical protein
VPTVYILILSSIQLSFIPDLINLFNA